MPEDNNILKDGYTLLRWCVQITIMGDLGMKF